MIDWFLYEGNTDIYRVKKRQILHPANPFLPFSRKKTNFWLITLSY